MEQPKSEPKLPDMVMCGDHPSFGKMELNTLETSAEKKEKAQASFTRVMASSSRTGAAEVIAPSGSEAALRMLEARRRVRSLEAVSGQDGDAATPENRAIVQEVGPRCEALAEAALKSLEMRGRGRVSRANNAVVPNNRLLMQAALGSFRWPPYLLCIWVAVLVLTHLLHCLVTVLERMLPKVRKFCHYFKLWTEEAWQSETEPNRLFPVTLAFVTVVLYTIYFSLYAMYTVAFWSIEPLCSDVDVSKSNTELGELKASGCESAKSCFKK